MLCAFPTLTETDFEQFGVNEYALLDSVVVGTFPMYSARCKRTSTI